MNLEKENSAFEKCTPEHVAGVLTALGNLMHDLHRQDLALQKAISNLAVNATDTYEEVAHIQHIDLITQTHEDLARFLPELATALERTDFDYETLAERLRLQSLRDQLLKKNNSSDETEPVAGELSLF